MEPSWQGPDEHRSWLESLPLPLRVLRDSLKRGQLAQDMCTRNHPPAFPGTAAWGETNCAVREFLATFGWRPLNRRGVPLAVAPDESIGITAITGDKHTGDLAHSPMTKRPRGAVGIEAVLTNIQYLLFEEFADANRRKLASRRATWFLLYARRGDVLHAELSLPAGITRQGIIENWRRRIILPTIDLTEPPSSEDGDTDPDIDVPVRRRSG